MYLFFSSMPQTSILLQLMLSYDIFFHAYRDLVNEGIFDVIADILQSEDKKLVLTA